MATYQVLSASPSRIRSEITDFRNQQDIPDFGSRIKLGTLTNPLGPSGSPAPGETLLSKISAGSITHTISPADVQNALQHRNAVEVPNPAGTGSTFLQPVWDEKAKEFTYFMGPTEGPDPLNISGMQVSIPEGINSDNLKFGFGGQPVVVGPAEPLPVLSVSIPDNYKSSDIKKRSKELTMSSARKSGSPHRSRKHHGSSARSRSETYRYGRKRTKDGVFACGSERDFGSWIRGLFGWEVPKPSIIHCTAQGPISDRSVSPKIRKHHIHDLNSPQVESGVRSEMPQDKLPCGLPEQQLDQTQAAIYLVNCLARMIQERQTNNNNTNENNININNINGSNVEGLLRGIEGPSSIPTSGRAAGRQHTSRLPTVEMNNKSPPATSRYRDSSPIQQHSRHRPRAVSPATSVRNREPIVRNVTGGSHPTGLSELDVPRQPRLPGPQQSAARGLRLLGGEESDRDNSNRYDEVANGQVAVFQLQTPLGSREVVAFAIRKSPDVTFYQKFMTQQEIIDIKSLASPYFKVAEGGFNLSMLRHVGDHPLVLRLRERVANFLNVNVRRVENPILAVYPSNCNVGRHEPAAHQTHTLLISLQDTPDHMITSFPELGFSLPGLEGGAVCIHHRDRRGAPHGMGGWIEQLDHQSGSSKVVLVISVDDESTASP